MSFGYYRSVTIDHTKCGSSDSTNFPVLFNTTHNDLRTAANGGHVQNANGYDIAFYSDSGLTTALSFELERYNASTGEVIVWFKVGTLSHASDTVVYVAYGDSGISSNQSSTATWDSHFKGVFHTANGSTLSLNDSTSNGSGATGTNTPTAAAGKIDGGVGFASASSQIAKLASGTFDTGAATYECWVNFTSIANTYTCLMGRGEVTTTNDFNLFVKSNGKIALYGNAPGNVNYDGTGSHTLTTGTFYYVCGMYSSSVGGIGYVNGASDGTFAAGGALTTSPAATPYFGGQGTGGGRYVDGIMDEIRFSDSVRSGDWITSCYNNQNSPSTFYTLGSEVPAFIPKPWMLPNQAVARASRW